jgi:2-polyprenyl-3-methyl-5-hydroxy-6-metoxy-1,4-benzoquinol methylase
MSHPIDLSLDAVVPDEFESGRFHWSQRYDYTPEEYERRRRRYAWNYRFLLALPRSAHVLEIGCGGGFFLHFLQRAGFTNCAGIDLDPSAVEACHRNVTQRVVQAEAKAFLRASREHFDLIVSNHVVEHMPRAAALSLLRASIAQLSPGGTICLATPNAMTPWSGFHLYDDPTHCCLYTPQSLEELLLEAGFERIEITGEGPVPYDVLTAARYLLWRIRRRWLHLLFAVDVGIGRTKRVKALFEQGLIARAHRPLE